MPPETANPSPRKRRRRVDPVNLANFLTLCRILLVPVILWMLETDTGRPGIADDYFKLGAMVVVWIASLTDYYDGKIAREYQIETKLGKFLDPVADKLLVCSIFVVFVSTHRVAPWILIAMLWREFAVLGLRVQLASERVNLGASRWAKFKTIFQLTAVIAMLITMCLEVLAVSGDLAVPLVSMVYFDQIAGSVVLFSLVLSLVSGLEYFKQHWRILKRG